MVRHIHQEFLMDIPPGVLDPETYRATAPPPADVRDWKEPRDLFDWPGPFVRKASLSEWERLATTPKALQTLLAPLRGIDKLLLLDDRPRSDSPVSRAVASAHLRAFLWFCLEAAIRCLWTDAPEAPSPALVLP